MRTEPIEGDAPAQAYARARKLLPKRLQPMARGLRKRLAAKAPDLAPPFSWVYSFTQVSAPRQRSIVEKAQALVAAGVAGDFVECGVLDGGTAALLAYAARHDARRVHLFDAWAGMPPATPEDGPGARKWEGEIVGSPARVARALKRVGANTDNIVIHRGWFEDTLPSANIGAIAFLHVDCDFFAPTSLVLETFLPRMVPGGIVQIDDYTSFEGCRRAVNATLERRPDLRLIIDDGPGGAIYVRIPRPGRTG